MVQTIKHAKTSAVPDGSDTAQVQPSDWNANHTITGTVDQSDVTNLVTDLAAKAPLASPTFTGDPKAPTPAVGDNTTSIATTAYVKKADDDLQAAIFAGFPLAATVAETLQGDNLFGYTSPGGVGALWTKGASTASAATITLGDGGYFHITGNVAITDIDFAEARNGRKVWLIFDSILTLTHNATTLQLPGGANITTAAGDRALFVQDAADNVICLVYMRANGRAVANTASDVSCTAIGTEISATNVQAAIAELAAEPKAWRNRIINGDFSIDQRNNGVAQLVAAATSPYTLDRWQAQSGQAPGTFNVRRIADSNFPSEFLCTLTTATTDASLAAGDFYTFGQKIEGHNCQGLNWGNVNARPITISFSAMASSSIALPISVRNGANDRTWLGSISINTSFGARKSFTVPGDTTGTWLVDNGIGLDIRFGLGVGTTYQGVAGWQAGNFLGLAGTTNVMAGAATVTLKDFQVEIGDVATAFERVGYSERLARCQRYYEVALCVVGTTSPNATGTNQMAWHVTKRVTPTLVATFDSGTGATFATTGGANEAIYQSGGHSSIGTATVRGSAEL